MTKVETGLKDMKLEFGNIENILGSRIFDAILGNQVISTNSTSWFLTYNYVYNLIIYWKQQFYFWMPFVC